MFQNIANEKEEIYEENKLGIWSLIKNSFDLKDIVLYVMCAAMGGLAIRGEFTPFGVSMLASLCSNSVPILIPYMLILAGTIVEIGIEGGLSYIAVSILFMILILIFRKRIQYVDKNEGKKLGKYLVGSSLIIQSLSLIINGFIVYDVLVMIINSILTYIFYKIFSNSIDVIRNIGEKRVYSIEEIIGASIIVSLSTMALGEFSILGFEIRNILNILIVLVLGWQNGMLVGATSGITIGSVLGIMTGGNIEMIAAYSISGMISGFLGKFGRWAVILGFVLGSIGVCYMQNGGVEPIIYLKEILIASIGLLIMPKNMKIDIKLEDEQKCIGQGPVRVLTQSDETVMKLNNISDAISQMADTYNEVSQFDDENTEIITEEEKENIRNNLSDMQDNFLYDELMEDNEILEKLIERTKRNGEIFVKDIIEVFKESNNYIVGTENKDVETEIYRIVKRINDVYKADKIKSMWEQKMNDKKKNMSDQLNKVSKAISNLAIDIQDKEEKTKVEEKFEIKVGIGTATKAKSEESGDSNLYIKLDDGKHLIAISDGMGSGRKAKKSSNAAIKMLEKLLIAGFDRDESIRLINSNLALNEEEMYATLDVTVLDLAKGNIEFIKNGACPTFIKNGKYVQAVKSLALPTGILDNIDLIVFDRDIEDGDIIVMCSDGIVESNPEYKNKEMWLKNMLEKIETDDVQKIANIVLQEAIDNSFGVAKDDMTVVVTKVCKKQDVI